MNLFKTKTGGRLLVFLMAMALIFVFAACEWTLFEKDKEKEEGTSGIDYDSYNTAADRAFMVRNNTSKKLVAFKSSLALDNILGGIPANAMNHGIKRNATLLGQTSGFPMILITEEDYLANKDTLATSSLNQTPFTRVYVYYNAAGDNSIVYEISGRLGGDKIIEIGNPSQSLNVEIRLGGIYGEVIGFAPAGMNSTRLFVTEGDFDLFPVFKRYNPQRDVVETLYPKAAQGRGAWFYSLGFDDNTNSAYFNVQNAINALTTSSTSGVAYLVINNQSTSGAVRLIRGSEVIRAAGVAYINSSSQKTITVEMPSVGIEGDALGTFADSLLLSSLLVGPTANEVNIQSVEDGSTNLQIMADTMYVINVTGDRNMGTLRATIEMREGEPNGPTAVPIAGWN